MITNRKLYQIGAFVLVVNGILIAQVVDIELKKRSTNKYLKRMGDHPIPIPFDLKDRVKELLGYRVSLRGRYNHASEMEISPRHFITEHMETASYKEDHIGSYIVTPFYCSELKESVLINRGWIPKQLGDPKTREEGQVEGEVSLVCVVTHSPKILTQTKKNFPEQNKWSYIDVSEMAMTHGTQPILLDCSYASSAKGGPIGGQHDFGVSRDQKDYWGYWYSYFCTGGFILFFGYLIFRATGRRALLHYRSNTVSAKDFR